MKMKDGKEYTPDSQSLPGRFYSAIKDYTLPVLKGAGLGLAGLTLSILGRGPAYAHPPGGPGGGTAPVGSGTAPVTSGVAPVGSATPAPITSDTVLEHSGKYLGHYFSNGQDRWNRTDLSDALHPHDFKVVEIRGFDLNPQGKAGVDNGYHIEAELEGDYESLNIQAVEKQNSSGDEILEVTATLKYADGRQHVIEYSVDDDAGRLAEIIMDMEDGNIDEKTEQELMDLVPADRVDTPRETLNDYLNSDLLNYDEGGKEFKLYDGRIIKYEERLKSFVLYDEQGRRQSTIRFESGDNIAVVYNDSMKITKTGYDSAELLRQTLNIWDQRIEVANNVEQSIKSLKEAAEKEDPYERESLLEDAVNRAEESGIEPAIRRARAAALFDELNKKWSVDPDGTVYDGKSLDPNAKTFTPKDPIQEEKDASGNVVTPAQDGNKRTYRRFSEGVENLHRKIEGLAEIGDGKYSDLSEEAEDELYDRDVDAVHQEPELTSRLLFEGDFSQGESDTRGDSDGFGGRIELDFGGNVGLNAYTRSVEDRLTMFGDVRLGLHKPIVLDMTGYFGQTTDELEEDGITTEFEEMRLGTRGRFGLRSGRAIFMIDGSFYKIEEQSDIEGAVEGIDVNGRGEGTRTGGHVRLTLPDWRSTYGMFRRLELSPEFFIDELKAETSLDVNGNISSSKERYTRILAGASGFLETEYGAVFVRGLHQSGENNSNLRNPISGHFETGAFVLAYPHASTVLGASGMTHNRDASGYMIIGVNTWKPEERAWEMRHDIAGFERRLQDLRFDRITPDDLKGRRTMLALMNTSPDLLLRLGGTNARESGVRDTFEVMAKMNLGILNPALGVEDDTKDFLSRVAVGGRFLHAKGLSELEAMLRMHWRYGDRDENIFGLGLGGGFARDRERDTEDMRGQMYIIFKY